LGIPNVYRSSYSQFIPWNSQTRSAAENPKEEKYKMKNMKQILTNLMNEDSGQDLIEYALVAALVGLGAVAAMGTLKSAISNTFNTIGTSLTNATT